MKPVKLSISNIGILKEVEIPLDKDAVILTGEVRQGKTTILNCIKFLFGTTYPNDIIRHGQREAFIQVDFEDGSTVRKEFYIGRDGLPKKRAVQYNGPDGLPISKPADKLKEIISPLTLNQDMIINMTGAERRKYFVEVFNVDTTEQDKIIKEQNDKISEIKAEIKTLPITAPEEVTIVDTAPIKLQINAIKSKNEGAMAEYYKKDSEERTRVENIKKERAQAEHIIEATSTELSALKAEQKRIQEKIENAENTIGHYKELSDESEAPAYVAPEQPELESTTELEAELEEAIKSEYEYKEYIKNKELYAKRVELERELKDAADAKHNAVNLKFAKLKEINDEHQIPGLEFKDDGGFTFEDTDADMLSTSQLMRLTSLMSKQYPGTVAIETVDRAESLGESILEHIQRAAIEKKTILASIVGEYPAEASDKVGVFVVRNGEVE